MYPALCTVFLSLVVAAVVTAILGAYSFISMRVSVFQFHWTPVMLVLTHVSLLALIAVMPLTLLALLLWCVCPSYRRAIVCKSFYIIGLLITALLLAAAMAAAIFVIYGASQQQSYFAQQLRKAWIKELAQDTTLPCQIQFQLGCHGFETADCQKGSSTQNFARCGTNCLPEHEQGKPRFNIEQYPGCRGRMSDFFIRWNAILLAGSTTACILSLIALFFTCTAVSFEKDDK
ncbi:unnamed protein product [Agarophyton chilense]